MAYNPWKKLDEIKYGTTPTSSSSPVLSSSNNAYTKPAGAGYGYAGTTDAFKPVTAKPPSQPSYLANSQTLADQQKKQYEERKAKALASQEASSAEKNRYLSESIPRLQQQFSSAETAFKGASENAVNKANTAKQSIGDEAGIVQRQNAETLRTGREGIANRFANLGTSDSYGAGSHMQAQENVQSDFNRLTANNARNTQNQKAEIDQKLFEYQTEAQGKIDSLKIDLENAVLKIQSDMTMNNLAKQDAIDSIIASYEDAVGQVDSEMNNLLKEYQLKSLELEKTSLSPEFMATGKPQNENDYKFLVENSEKYDKYGAMLGTGAKTNEGTSKITSTIDRILGGNVAGISGAATTNWIPGVKIWSGSGQTQSDWENLKSMLSLEGRQQLKGSGAISDFEAKILEKASTMGIDPTNMSTDEFVRRLTDLKNELSGSTNQSNSIRVQSPDGQTGTIDQSELEAALASGWRRI